MSEYKDTISKNNKRISAVIPIENYNKLVEISEREDRSLSYLINSMIKEYIKDKWVHHKGVLFFMSFNENESNMKD